MNYEIFTHKTDLMRALQIAVSRSGYTRYTRGKIKPKKAKILIYKFEDRYGISLTKQQRWYRKKKGEAQACLYLLQEKNDTDIQFFLLVSDGDGPVVDLETLYDFTSKEHRLVLDGFEFLRVAKKGGQRWTWRMTSDRYMNLRKKVEKYVKQKREKDIEQCVFELRVTPPFPECNRQVREILKRINALYLRVHKEKKEFKVFKGFYGRFKTPRTKLLK